MPNLRFGARLLARSPIFAATSILLLAIGIGANTLIFSIVNALLLRPLPVDHPENLVRLVEIHSTDFVTWDLPYGLCNAVAAHDADFSEVLCQGEYDVAFTDGSSTGRVRTHLVSPNFFSSLAVHAYLGRVLNEEDERTAATNAVLGYGFWQRRFHADPAVLGRGIVLAGHAFTIVGVTPENFNGLNADTSPDVRVPASADRLLIQPDPALTAAARPLFGQIFARLRPGVPFERADARVDAALEQAYQDETARIFPGSKQVPSSSRLRLQSIANGVSNLRTQFAPSLQVLMGGVALLLLMACVNVAGLLLARSAVRAQEFTVRRALGASSWRIVRQLLTEGLLLAIPGGIGGTLLAAGCLPLLMRAMPPQRDRAAVLQPLAVHVTLDGRVLAFTALVALATAILFALSPALRAAGGATRTTSARSLGRNLIVSAQVALCTVILIGAALLIATLEHMRTMNIGFDRDHVVTFTIDPGIRNYKPEAARALSKTLLEKVRALPGVDGAAIASRAVMRGTGVKATLQAAGARVTPADFLNASLNEVTPAYFETMDMHILAGRDFNAFDRNKTAPRQVIVNQSFARRFFPGRDPIGQRFGYAGPGGLAKPDDEIVGVVTDAKYRSVREPVPPTVYTSADGFDSSFILHVRTHEHPEAMIAPVGESLRALDAEMPVIEARTLREEVETSLWQERLLAWLSTVFGAIAALLASIGLYGALDYAVKSRTREIGIRVAIGAPPSQIMAMLARETGAFIAAGALLGVLAYAAAAVWIRRVLYEVGAWEPAAVVSVLGLIAIIAAIALAPPILRAMRINPGSALRAE